MPNVADAHDLAQETPPARGGWLDSLKLRVIAATSVLLAVPAMFGAGQAAMSSFNRMVTPSQEEINTRLFKKYFRAPPLLRQPVLVTTKAGPLQMVYSVYQGGEVNVEYGESSQWFDASPIRSVSMSSFFLSTAQAQTRDEAFQARLKQYEALNGNKLTRVVEMQGGSAEVTTYDIRSGNVDKRRVMPLKSALASPAFANGNVSVTPVVVPQMKRIEVGAAGH